MSQSKNELNTILKRISDEQDKKLNLFENDEVQVLPFELGHQAPVIRGRMPGLEAVYDRFARNFGQTFSHHVRRPVTITRRATELVSFRDYLEAISAPASMTIFGMNPLQGHSLFVFEHHLVHILIDLLFGGNGWFENPPPKREFTGIEIRMLTKVVYGALDDLGKAWKSLTPLEPFFERIEINPKFTAIVPPEEVVASTTFDVEINRVPYTMSFCLPYAMLDPVRTRIEAGKSSYDEEINAINVSRLEENLRNSKIGVKVALGEARMTLRHFLSLQSGDRILLDQDQDKPLKVMVQEKLKFYATQGAYKGKNAVQITDLINPPQRFTDLLDQVPVEPVQDS